MLFAVRITESPIDKSIFPGDPFFSLFCHWPPEFLNTIKLLVI